MVVWYHDEEMFGGGLGLGMIMVFDCLMVNSN